MQSDFIWHKLSAHLASVMIALHDFFPQRLRHQLSLAFTVILFQRCFEADFLQLSINLITRMIKTTSLVLMIGVVEVIKVAQQIIEANRTASPNAAFGIYLTVFVLYFLACWPISLLASYLEKKWK